MSQDQVWIEENHDTVAARSRESTFGTLNHAAREFVPIASQVTVVPIATPHPSYHAPVQVLSTTGQQQPYVPYYIPPCSTQYQSCIQTPQHINTFPSLTPQMAYYYEANIREAYRELVQKREALDRDIGLRLAEIENTIATRVARSTVLYMNRINELEEQMRVLRSENNQLKSTASISSVNLLEHLSTFTEEDGVELAAYIATLGLA
jgi:hypothetical protein